MGRTLERKFYQADLVGEDFYPSFRWVEKSGEKIKIERATGPYDSMASGGWGDTTTTQDSD